MIPFNTILCLSRTYLLLLICFCDIIIARRNPPCRTAVNKDAPTSSFVLMFGCSFRHSPLFAPSRRACSSTLRRPYTAARMGRSVSSIRCACRLQRLPQRVGHLVQRLRSSLAGPSLEAIAVAGQWQMVQFSLIAVFPLHQRSCLPECARRHHAITALVGRQVSPTETATQC